MRSINGDGSVDWDAQDSGPQEEKIFVAVRLRPLNAKELVKNRVSDWECINKTSLTYRNAHQERPSTPTAYTFDRVFGGGCSTRQVYEEAAKKIALSGLSGINSTIFAYGQTSSGKTYTMSGITGLAVADIYDYIDKHPERDFMFKFSALEIYNEQVKDLLCPYGSPLRLLDDPERGTVVDKLTEVTLRDMDHLHELLSVCAAQRQTGETALNEVSSRSHQILRLTIESEAHHYSVAEKTGLLTATVNFVDLAGSERASQTKSRGSRLKEGSHINRSLLTLGTVIRKLSKGGNAHVPYRDSKLTRILQNSLGGNARTAIVCTLSPARCHVEQSKNTLVFASCAKQVCTNAQVNVAMSDKMMVKQLQNELNRLENELRGLRSLSALSFSASALKEKEILLEKLEKDVQELTHQRDLAFARVESMLSSGSSSQASKSSVDMSNPDKVSDESSTSEASEIYDPHRSNVSPSTTDLTYNFDGLVSRRSEDQFPENIEEQFFSGNISPTQYIDKYFGPDPYTNWEKLTQETSKKFKDTCKEVQCIETDSTNTDLFLSSPPRQSVDHALDVELSPCSPDNNTPYPNVCVSRSSSCEDMLTPIAKSPCSENKNTLENEAENQEDMCVIEKISNSENVCREDSPTAIQSDCMDEQDQYINTLGENYVGKKEAFVKEVTEVVLPKLVKQIEFDMDMEEEEDEMLTSKPKPEKAADVGTIKTPHKTQPNTYWTTEFEEKMKEIIILWDACHVPLVHRTYFFLLFKGDPLDTVYVDVELRRLSFLQDSINGAAKDDLSLTQTSRIRAVNREREMLSRRIMRKYSNKEREEVYLKWGVDVKSKQRRIQLCRKLWTDTTNMEHISESSAIVAKLVGFKEPGEVTTEMFGLSLLPNASTGGFFSWTHSLLPYMMQG